MILNLLALVVDRNIFPPFPSQIHQGHEKGTPSSAGKISRGSPPARIASTDGAAGFQ
jgi:hypothetical protein